MYVHAKLYSTVSDRLVSSITHIPLYIWSCVGTVILAVWFKINLLWITAGIRGDFNSSDDALNQEIELVTGLKDLPVALLIELICIIKIGLMHLAILGGG